MQHPMNNNAMQLIAQRCAEFFGVASYRLNRNEYFPFYRCIFFIVLKSNDIRKKIVLQKFFVDVQKKFIGAEYNVKLFQRFFFVPECPQHPAFYCRRIFYPESCELVRKKNSQAGLNSFS